MPVRVDVTAFVTAGRFLIAVLWFDLMFDVLGPGAIANSPPRRLSISPTTAGDHHARPIIC
jgi:hypothetical protein